MLKSTRLHLISFLVLLLTVGILAGQAPRNDRQPLEVARLLAAKYPESPIMSYIPGIAWANSLRLAQLTGEDKWKEKPRRDMEQFLSGAKRGIAQPYLLTSLAGHLALSDLGEIDKNAEATAQARKAADFILSDNADEVVKYGRKWTDDMFMATTLLARVGARTKDERYGRAAGRLLTSYAEKLQRPDGLFIHALDGPHGLAALSEGRDDGKRISLRWIVCHLIEEYARHNGHADLLRESIDGATGD